MRYLCACRYCNREFYSTTATKDVCNNYKCQEKLKKSKSQHKARYSIAEVESLAISYSRKLGKFVSYGQVSLLVEYEIKVF